MSACPSDRMVLTCQPKVLVLTVFFNLLFRIRPFNLPAFASALALTAVMLCLGSAQAQSITPLWTAPQGMGASPAVQAWQTQQLAERRSADQNCPRLETPVWDPERPTYAYGVQPGDELLRPVVYVQDYMAQDVWLSGTDASGCPFLKHAGRHVDMDRLDILSPYPNFVLPRLQAGTQAVVLVQDSKGKVPLVGLMDAADLTRQSVSVFLGVGVMAATLMTILIISVVFFLRQNLADIRANLTFTASLWLWILQTYSLGEAFIPFWPGSAYFAWMQGLTVTSVILSAGWCFTRFAITQPRLKRLFFGAVALAGALLFVAQSVPWLMSWAQDYLLVLGLVAVFLTFKVLRKREAVKLFYGLGFLCFILGGLLQTAAQTMFNNRLGLQADFGVPIGAVLLTMFWLIATVFLVRQHRAQNLECMLKEAGTDKLTGLWNRDYLTHQIAQRLQAGPQPREGLSVFLLDLDNFKFINDTQGHQQGDALLQVVAQRIQDALRQHLPERALAGRFGGDEFVILLEPGVSLMAKRTLAQALMAWINLPVMLSNREVKVGVSMGYLDGQGYYENAQDMLRDADIAMYEAKKRGRGQAVMFQPHMQMWVEQRFSLENALAQAIQDREFELFFQPIVNLRTGAHAGLEALVRWNSPSRGMVSPAAFIPLAEENGMIEGIGRQVLEMATQTVASWKQQGLWREGWYVSVNVSGRQLSGSNLFEEMQSLLVLHGLSAQDLHLELTESAVITNLEAANTELPLIKQSGVALCMDDFGTGYSSLSYLSRLPFDVLKIDRSFIDDLVGNERCQALIRTVLALARDMKLKVVAEGVEQADQRDWLSRMDCDFGQGYLFSKPLSAIDTRAWLVKANVPGANFALT